SHLCVPFVALQNAGARCQREPGLLGVAHYEALRAARAARDVLAPSLQPYHRLPAGVTRPRVLAAVPGWPRLHVSAPPHPTRRRMFSSSVTASRWAGLTHMVLWHK